MNRLETPGAQMHGEIYHEEHEIHESGKNAAFLYFVLFVSFVVDSTQVTEI